MFTIFRRLGVIGLLVGVCSILPAVSAQPSVPPYNRDEPPGEPPAVPGYEKAKSDKEGPQVQGRGPIHEGFAQPIQPPRPGAVVPTAPPAPIEEQPPEEKPRGDNVVWVPGYWAWDAERQDFLWVSGFWRVAPKGRKWMPGYWAKTDRGHQWVGGFWASTNLRQLPYVPDAPPDSLDRGPSVPPPDDSYEYVPGCWLYQNDRYLWQPGYWYQPRSGLVWCPPRWCWTPRGYLFVNGFWDACLEDRGILFAPVYFPRPLWRRPGYVFSPHYAVPTAGL